MVQDIKNKIIDVIDSHDAIRMACMNGKCVLETEIEYDGEPLFIDIEIYGDSWISKNETDTNPAEYSGWASIHVLTSPTEIGGLDEIEKELNLYYKI